jgi:hypothetical protein
LAREAYGLPERDGDLMVFDFQSERDILNVWRASNEGQMSPESAIEELAGFTVLRARATKIVGSSVQPGHCECPLNGQPCCFCDRYDCDAPGDEADWHFRQMKADGQI